MIRYKTYTEEVKRPELITCDICKKEYDYDNWIELQEFHFVNFVGGYGSVFGDGNTIRLDICQHCLLEMINKYI
ncbi:MAG: hypothetical protein WC055_00930 [Melioribacteraceae bacterium]